MMMLPSCQEVTKTLAEAADPIPWHKAALLRLHMAMCDHCSRFERQLRLIGDALRSRRPSPASVQAVQKKLRDRLTKG